VATNKEVCAQAASLIRTAFTWEDTSKGFYYWQRVVHELEVLSGDTSHCPNCGYHISKETEDE
jgi:hypothetical protein